MEYYLHNTLTQSTKALKNPKICPHSLYYPYPEGSDEENPCWFSNGGGSLGIKIEKKV